MTDELELKYAVADVAALEARLDREFPPSSSVGRWRQSRVTDRYFDTADHALEQAGYGARLRRTRGTVVVGLKKDVATSGGLHHRLELEATAAASLRPERWPRSEVRELVERVSGRRRLVERFVLRQRRRERTYSPREGAACLLSIDRVTVIAGGRQHAELEQLEVELVEGDVGALREMAGRIESSGLVVAEPRSKMAIAAGLLDGSGPIGPGDPFAEAGRRVLHRHLRRMLEREAHVRSGDVLALKQMRVATRRMRAVWRVFDGAYRRAAQRRHLAELRHVADRLGAVRDLDVLIEALPADAALEPLAADWRARRQQAFEELLRTLDGPDYQRFVADYLAFARTPRDGVARSLAGARVADVAADRIWSAHERVLAHLPSIRATPPGRGPDVAALHALRIDAKRLRYTLETFRDVLAEPFVSDLVGRLVRLQDHLGEVNDARVAAEAVRHWLDVAGSSAPAESVAAAGGYLAGREAAVERLGRSHARPLRGVAGVTFERRLARAIGPLTER